MDGITRRIIGPQGLNPKLEKPKQQVKHPFHLTPHSIGISQMIPQANPVDNQGVKAKRQVVEHETAKPQLKGGNADITV